ncbi:MAG: DNA-directed RNA polymerase subunit omega [Deltaproteobacteria bacterium]|nr:DNA-directed RNA polymerase subunit omega [Deltaproteobacteria bacterium]MCX7952453.1 DNA-directed RNA polymerase subunit omega [Deltaproteobacteria bacterium]
MISYFYYITEASTKRFNLISSEFSWYTYRFMARITIEDCLKHIDNRFLVTIVAILRARQILSGATPVLEEAKKRGPVLAALLEIENGLITPTKQKPQEADGKAVSRVLESVFKRG